MSQLPATFLRTWSILTRWLLGVLLLVWLVMGLAWGTLHWVIVPRIAEWRPLLEQRVTQALGVSVHIGAIRAQSNGLVPAFELADVRLLDAQGRVGLSLPRVLIAVSPRSLWHLGFEQLYIDQPTLEVRRSADGRISVGAFDSWRVDGDNSAALDWLFAQRELVIHQGVLRWSDALRALAPVQLRQLDLVLRNGARQHDLRIDAKPPDSWGAALSLQGMFTQPLLSLHGGQWRAWDGQLYADLSHIDLSELHRYADLPVDLQQGRGALRAWVDVRHGQLTALLTDLALSEVSVKLGADLATLDLQRIYGRLGVRRLPNGLALSMQDLRFDTTDGLHWAGGQLRLELTRASAALPAGGVLQSDRLDLAALAQIAGRLPLDAVWRERLAGFAPKGQVESLALQWQGEFSAPTSYRAHGKFSQLEVAAVAPWPGVSGVDLDFDLTELQGQAKLSMLRGSLDLPGIFQESLVPIDQAQARLNWQRQGAALALQVSDASFSNADAQGQAQLKWQTSDPLRSPSHSSYPGVLDLQANLTRADAKRVSRYLPLVIDEVARNYVRDALLAGSADKVSFRVKGEISELPKVNPAQGWFKISAAIQHATLAYVPRSLQGSAQASWPVLSELSAELLIDRTQLQVRNARARLGDAAKLRVVKAQALIADLKHAQVEVSAELSGALPDALDLVNRSPLTSMLSQALEKASATGNAQYQFKLQLPLADLAKSTLQGRVILAGNALQISPDTPKFSRASGLVNFSQSGFSLSQLQARALGGEVHLEGGLQFGSPLRGAPLQLHASGVASAEALSQASELGWLARLARQASGTAHYSVTLGMPRGQPELLVSSDLQGMALRLPAPLQKDASSSLPLRWQTVPVPHDGALQDRLSVSLASIGQLNYERDLSDADAKVLRGSLAIGLSESEVAPMPRQGVHANVNLAKFNADAWSEILKDSLATQPVASELVGASAAAMSYLPSTWAVRAQALILGGRQFNQVVMGGERSGSLWRANVHADELNGYLAYRQAGPDGAAGGFYARLARLSLAPSAANEVDELLDTQPASLPALDVVVDDFELRGKHLGRLELAAVNHTGDTASEPVREWRLSKFNLIAPEASLQGSGNWARLNASAGAAALASVAQKRRTELNFKLDIHDGGALLERLGMHDMVRRASGTIEGQVAWLGAPLKIDYPTLHGSLRVNFAGGQFLKADPGIGKLLGVLSLQALPRRLTLDFRDVFSEGFAFDFVRGDVTVDRGMARTNNLQMKGVNAAVLMDGQADLANETQDLKVLVVPEINTDTASLIATVINPAVGLGSFLAQLIVRRPLIESATQEFHVSGNWSDPQVSKVALPRKGENKP